MRLLKLKLKLVALFLCTLTFTGFVNADVLEIPILVGQTGAAISFGKNETDAYLLAAEEWNSRGGVNGKKVKLIFEDTRSNLKDTYSAFYKLAQAKPAVIMGPSWLDSSKSLVKTAMQKDILLVSPSAAIESFDGTDKNWVVSFYHNSTTEARDLLAEIKKRNLKNIALLYEEEPFSQTIRSLLIAEGGVFQHDIGVLPGTTDFNAIMSKLRAKKPDVVLLLVWQEQSVLALLKQLKLFLSGLPLATIHDGEGWLKTAIFKDNLDQIFFTVFEVADKQFEKKFTDRFAYKPILSASNAYDALNVVLNAYASGKKSAKEIRKYIMDSDHETATFGKFKFGDDGEVPSKTKVINYSR